MAKRFTKLLAALALLVGLAIPMGMRGQTRDTQTVSYGWETTDDADPWTISESIVATSGEGNTGTYAGKINTNSTVVQFNEKVYVTSFSYAFKRTSNNNNYSVYIETSTDGSNWSIKDTQAMNTFTNGSYRTVTKEFDGTQELYVRFRCNNTTAVRYVDDVTITYNSSAAQLDPSDLTLTNASTSFVFDLYDNADAQVVNYTTSSTGEVIVADSEYITTVVDQNNKTITVTPVAVTNGAKVITVNQAADDNYAAGSKTFTINITDSTPFSGGDVTFVATVDKDLENTSQGEGSITKSGVTFACNNGILGNGSEYRLYKNSVTTFSVTEGIITQIAFTCTSGNPATGFATQTGWTTEGNNGTWTGNAQEVTFTASGAQVRATSIVVTVETGGTPALSITAQDINLTFDATSGSIVYTINNPVVGGTMSVAVTEGDWLTLGASTESPISFTCTENTGAERTAVVTLTYTYERATVTKDVTVTQAAAPVIYTTIPELFAAATGTETNVLVNFNNYVVSGVSTNGKNVFVTDNNGNGFVIFSNTDQSSTYAVGSILSGTAVSCTLKLYNGFAELLNVNASDLTIATGGTVTTANIAMANLAGVNTGALVHYENLTCSVASNKYYLTDGTTTLQVYTSLYDFGALENGKTYNITGIYQQYNTTKEILPRSADDIEEVASTVPSITVTPTTVNFAATAPGEYQTDSLTIAYENIEVTNYQSFTVQFYDNQGNETEASTYIWLVVGVTTGLNDEGYVVRCITGNNDGDARTAYFKVYAYDAESNKVYSELVTVNQAEYVAPTYAELPFSFNGGRSDIEGTDGLYQEGLGTDYNATNNPTTKLKFDGTGDWLLLQFDERPGTLTFDIKNNSFSGGTFKVQTSEDGVTYTDLETYTEISGTQNEEFTNLGENVRYIKWIYTNKSSGNVGLGNIALAKYEVPVIVPSITITPDNFELDANAHMVEYLTTLAYENIVIVPGSTENFGIQYCDAEGNPTEHSWCGVSVTAVENSDDFQLVLILATANDGNEARTAYFKVFGHDAEDNVVYSNLVSITQAAPVIDYAVLPFIWEGGPKADFLALNGVTAHDLGSDYAEGHTPYLIKFDNTDDYIQVKCDQQPGRVTIGVKMLGGGNTSTITIQGSADGETFTDIEELTISGAQNDELTLETTNVFGENDRYVRMVFTKGSNVGVGPITIEKGSAPFISVTPATVDLEAAGQVGETGYQMQSLTVTYNNLEITQAHDFAVQFYNAEGEEQTQPSWIEPDPTVVSGGNDSGYMVMLLIAPNEGPARSAYFKVYALGEENYVYSNLVTINQAGVAPRYTLTVEPFENLDLITFVNDEMVMEGDGEIQVNEGDQIMLSVVALEGYAMETLMVNGVNHVNDIADDFTYSFEMPAENVTISATAVEDVPVTPGTWVLTDLADLTEDDVFVIVGTRTDGTYGGNYAMSNDNGTSNPPAAVAVTVAEGTLSEEPAANLQWNISITEDSYTFYPNGTTETWLYCTNTNNGVRVGTNENNVFTMSENGYLYNTVTGRYIGIYNDQDWRCYTSEGGNIANQTFAFYKKVESDTQTINLSAGENWVSFYVDVTLDDLKAALLSALGDDATNIKITSQSNGYTDWDGSIWRGTLNPFDVSQMFVIEVTGACEISLEAMPVNPARPITIVNGTNWIGFPFSGNMSLSNAFSNFAENGDKILAPNGSFATYNGNNWVGGLETLQPGKGYKYEVTTTDVRTLVFPSSK